MKNNLLKTVKITLIFLAGAAARLAVIVGMAYVMLIMLSVADLLFIVVMMAVIALGIYAGFLVGKISEKKLRLSRMAGIMAYVFGAAVLLAVLIVKNECDITRALNSPWMFNGLTVAFGRAVRWILWGNAAAVAVNAVVQTVYTIVRKKDENDPR